MSDRFIYFSASNKLYNVAELKKSYSDKSFYTFIFLDNTVICVTCENASLFEIYLLDFLKKNPNKIKEMENIFDVYEWVEDCERTLKQHNEFMENLAGNNTEKPKKYRFKKKEKT